MPKIHTQDKIYVNDSKVAPGQRGVFAKSKFEKGQVVEKCPYIDISEHEIEILQNSTLSSYIYFFGKDKEQMLLPLGFGGLYNHSYSPNAKYIINQKDKIIEFVAVKEINDGEEIFVDYIQDDSKNVPLWFE